MFGGKWLVQIGSENSTSISERLMTETNLLTAKRRTKKVKQKSLVSLILSSRVENVYALLGMNEIYHALGAGEMHGLLILKFCKFSVGIPNKITS